MVELHPKNDFQRPLQVVKEIPVCTYDIDFAGIVSNIVYLRWLEDLRLKFLKTYLPLDQQFQNDYIPILSGTNIEYKRPIKLFDVVIGKIWVVNLGKVKWVLQAEIIANETIAATATQKGAFVDVKTLTPILIPNLLYQQYIQSMTG